MIQEQVLNKIIKDRDSSILTLNNLNVDYFSDYKDEFCFIKNHLTQYNVIPDMETFLSQFPDFKVIDVKEPTSYLLDQLVKDKTTRFIIENYSKVRESMLKDDPETAMGIIQQVADQSTSLVSLNAVDLIHNETRYDEYESKINNLDKYYIATGFPELDAITGGWDINEDLVTIVARNGVGKTWVLLKCAAAAAKQGKRVGIYSGEMSETTVGYRIDTILGHISNGALMHGGASVKNEYKKFLDSLSETIKGNLFVLTPKGINGPAGVTALKAFIDKYNLDILFVDQHSLLEDDRKGKSPVEKASNISKDLKLLQTIKRIPVVCVSQQNREKLEDGKSFDTTQIAQADRIGQDSSQIIFIEKKDDLMKLHLVKSRNTGCGNVLTYKVDLNNGEWTYIDEGNETVNSKMAEERKSEAMSSYSADEVF